ncbi:hypothetical protein HDU92_005778 [Lobulomyces angularis]|nr:hypothetical protein HDU92_005778 [Lobulomyces angularis]
MSSTVNLSPEVSWAQRANEIYLTIHLSDTSDQKFDLTPKSLAFSSLSDKKNYSFKFNFYGEIDVDESVFNKSPRAITIVLKKKEKDAAWWPKLLEGAKPHFLKVDFTRWKDEDEEVEPENPEGMGGMPGMPGMGGMGGMPGMPGMGGMDFQKMMGGGAGMPDMAQMMAQMGMDKGMEKDMSNLDAPDSDDEEEAAAPTAEAI